METIEKTRSFPNRLICYFVGLFIMTAGIAISVKSNLGVSPVSSIPYTMTRCWGLEMGKATISLRSGFDSSFDFAETISVEVAVANSSRHCVRLFYDILQLSDDLCTDGSQLCPSDWHVSGEHCSGCNRHFLLYAGKYHAARWGRCYAGSFRGDQDCLSESQGCI